MARRRSPRVALAVDGITLRVPLVGRITELTEREVTNLEELGDLVTRKEVDDARLNATRTAAEKDDAAFALRNADIQLELARIGERKAETEWERAKQDLAYATVRSPIRGIVAERAIETGELSSQSAPARCSTSSP